MRQSAGGANVWVVVHEIARQRYGNSVSVDGWKDIWINEGFARYSQWLRSEKEGEGTAQELADYTYAQHPADDPFWKVKPGDPGPDNQFGIAVHARGALALQALRDEVGDETFFELLKGRPAEHAHGNANVGDFVRYAERVSGKPLAALSDTWLYQPSRPAAPAAADAGPAGAALSARSAARVERPASWKKIAATNTVHDHGGHGRGDHADRHHAGHEHR